LGFLFNPFVGAIVAGTVVLGGAMALQLVVPSSRRRFFEKQSGGGVMRVSPDAPVTQMAQDIACKMGLAKAPDVYVLSCDGFIKMALPSSAERKKDDLAFRSQLRKGAMAQYFAAIPAANVI